MARKKKHTGLSVGKEIGVDLGSANTVIYMRDRGIVLREPSVVAVDKRSEELLAVGKEAKEMLGKSQSNIKLIRPIQGGVVAELDAAAAMLRAFLKKALNTGLLNRPKIVMAVPAGSTEVERTAAEDVARHSGGADVDLMEAPIAALLGSGISPIGPKGIMTMSLGAGHIEAAVSVLGQVISRHREPLGGNAMDEAVARYIKRKYGLLIGDLAAEEVKLKVGSAFPQDDELGSFTDVRGRSVAESLPKNITVHGDEIREALFECLESMARVVVRTTEGLEPQLAADVLDGGILLTGGGALLRGVVPFLQEATGLKVSISERPLDTVAEGLVRGLDLKD